MRLTRLLLLVFGVSTLLLTGTSGSLANPCKANTNASICGLTFPTLSGYSNNLLHPQWGQAGTQYTRTGKANYADGISKMQSGPDARRISNRVFNDLGQNVFSENQITQWGWAWGQFVDHDMDLRNEANGASAPIAFSATDPLERFSDTAGSIGFNRTLAAPGTGVKTPRQQINTISSIIDASQIYSNKTGRLRWLRQGPYLLLPSGYLPRADARGNPTTAPPMDLMGALTGQPTRAVVAGDVRANENLALTALQTLFAREHNRIVSSLPVSLGNDLRFQIARKIVGAEIQYITYTQFLPTLGVQLAPYAGYKAGVDPAVSNEFATVGFRAHSMVHGEFEITEPNGTYSAATLAGFAAEGITFEQPTPSTTTLVIPLAVAFGNPDLLQALGLGPALTALNEHEYKNDETIDDEMRSVLFEIPKPGVDPASCGIPAANPNCFTSIADLGADDVERGRDHGMPTYNEMRMDYGLLPVKSFTEITGESTDAFPAGLGCDSVASIAFTSLTDLNGNPVPLGDADNAVNATRGSTLAARLKCLYGNVNAVDAFVGMVSEKHLPGVEFGPLQLAIWKRQFTASRDGDRFFYLNDPALAAIHDQFGITYQYTLGQIVQMDAGVAMPSNVFRVGG